MNPQWLVEFHRQWQAARGRDATAKIRAFARDWDSLLNAAGLVSGESKAVAAREVEAFASAGKFEIRRPPRRRYLIDKVVLPLSQEAWLREQFSTAAPMDLRERSMTVVQQWSVRLHPLLAESSKVMCERLMNEFRAGRNLRPFYWHQPEANEFLLRLVFGLSARTWPAHTLVRDASVALGLDSKALEKHRLKLEAALSLLHERPMTLESLGLITANSRLQFDGPLALEFADGSRHEARNLRHGDWITAADLDRAVKITTTAKRLLTVENSKTTFPKLAELNGDRTTLIVATSFPTTAVKLLLGKISPNIPHAHFGDTDAAGYFILEKLRSISPRPVHALGMDWRHRAGSPKLTEYDHRVIAQLLHLEHMADVRSDLEKMLADGQKGDFEQETRELDKIWKADWGAERA